MGRAVPAGGRAAEKPVRGPWLPAPPPPGPGAGPGGASGALAPCQFGCSDLLRPPRPRPATCGLPSPCPPAPSAAAVAARRAPPAAPAPCPPAAWAPPPNPRGGRRRCYPYCCSASSGRLETDQEPVSTQRPALPFPPGRRECALRAAAGGGGGEGAQAPPGQPGNKGRRPRHGPRGALTCGAHSAAVHWPAGPASAPQALPGPPGRGRLARPPEFRGPRPGTLCMPGLGGRTQQCPRTLSLGDRGAPLLGGGARGRRAGCWPRAPPGGEMSPTRKAGREGGGSGRLARGPGSPGTRLSAGRRRRPPPAGHRARGSTESQLPGQLVTVTGRPGCSGLRAFSKKNLCEPVGERERNPEPAGSGTTGPALGGGGGQKPTAGQAKTPAQSGAPGLYTLCPPPYAHPFQDIVSTSRPALGHTQRHTKTYWLVARHPGPQTHTLNPRCTFAHHRGVHTFHSWHTHFRGHTLIPRGI